MKIKALAASAGFVAASLIAPAVLADSSSATEYRGYQKCVNAAEEAEALSLSRVYYLQREDDALRYFVNAGRWQDGEWERVRLRCETSTNGRTLLSSRVEDGSFRAPRGRVSVDVAAN